MRIPVLTYEQIQRIVQSEATWMNCRLTSMQEQFGSLDIQIARFGNALAFATRGLSDNPVYNRVIGLTAQDQNSVGAILQWYSEKQVPCQIDLCPYLVDRDLLFSLAKHGLYQSDYDTVLYGIPSPHTSQLPPNIVVCKAHQQDLNLFSSLYAQGFLEFYEGSTANIKLIADSMMGLYGRPGWHLYLAFVEEAPAAVALLHMEGQIASLVAATTVPQFRDRGCQTALLQQRIVDAADAGCTLLVTQTRVRTASQRNMERAGMRVAYTSTIWRTLET